jgi:hypothetical protein
MGLLHAPGYGGWGAPCDDGSRVSLTLDFGYSGKFTVPWHRRATRPLLRVAARIQTLNDENVSGVHPIPGRAPGRAGVYVIHQFGTYACRKPTCCPKGAEFSNHAWPLATDINWAQNPFHGSTTSWGPHDMPRYFVDAYTAEGFTWLAQYDPMHFERYQIDDAIEPAGGTGPLTLTDSPPWPGRRLIYVADAPMRGPDVAMWKARLKTLGAQGMDDTALFGTGADAATRAFQQTHGLTVDGVVGPLTWQAAWA